MVFKYPMVIVQSGFACEANLIQKSLWNKVPEPIEMGHLDL